MKKKTAKQPKQSKRTVKDLKPKKDAKGGVVSGGSSGPGVYKTKDSGSTWGPLP